MATEDSPTTSSYAPKSPDLSCLYAAGPTTPAPTLHHQPVPASCSSAVSLPGAHVARPQALPGYGPRGDETPFYGHVASVPPGPSASPAGQHDSWFQYGHYSPTAQLSRSPPIPQQSSSSSQTGAYDFQPSSVFLIQHVQSPSHQLSQQELRLPRKNLAHLKPSHVACFPSLPIPDHSQPQIYVAQPSTSTPTPQLATDMPPRRSAAVPPPPPMIEPSPVKTKFPTARIKRIMQADEEVGKVAQQTPIAVGKALELFMIQLVSRSADVAKDKGSKRVSAPMLKQVVEADDQWDFLRDIVSRVENEKEGSRSKKAESESDDEVVEPKRRGRGGGRRKKTT